MKKTNNLMITIIIILSLVALLTSCMKDKNLPKSFSMYCSGSLPMPWSGICS